MSQEDEATKHKKDLPATVSVSMNYCIHSLKASSWLAVMHTYALDALSVLIKMHLGELEKP